MNEPRRILHLISRLDGYGGGRMMRHLAARQAAVGAQVVVAALAAAEGPVAELRDRGVAVQVLGSRWPVDIVALNRLARLRGRLPVDLIHAWDIGALVSVVFTRRLGRGEALVATLDAASAKRPWNARLVQSVRKRVAAFAAGDEATVDWLQRCGVGRDRIEVIHLGVPPAAFSEISRTELLAQVALPPDAQLIAVAGPLRRNKNFDEAIWCFELVRLLHERARLLVFGDGPDRERLERFAAQVSEPGCVRFLGFRDDLAQWLSIVNVYWQLDAALATPLAMLEAMAARAPVVASDVPAHRAAIIPEESGCLAPLRSRAEVARATDELLREPERAQRIGAAARARIAERFSLDSACTTYDRLYQRVLQSTSARTG